MGVRPAAAASESDRLCYHCGLPLADNGARLHVLIGGAARPMCCAGCQAVAQAIVDNGLVDYYLRRDALPNSPRDALPEQLGGLGLFDHPDVQKGFVRPVGEHEREAALILEGITCAACVWLNEAHLARQPGVTAVEVNYATRRARVRWDERRIKLSGILAAIAAIGYRAHPYDVERSEELAKREMRGALWRLFVAGFGMMQVMMYAVPMYLADEGTMTPDIEQLMRWASLALTLPVIFYSAAPFFRNSWRDLRLRRVGMDLPVAIGVGSAFAASAWATLAGRGDVYFDSVAMFLFFLLVGRYLELVARQRAARGVEQLARVVPAFARRLPRYPVQDAELVPVAALAPGDALQVRPGEVFPADGVVLEGAGNADESLLTGESRPVAKHAGDAVIGGSTNESSPIVMRVERVGEATRWATIQRLMERAATERPHAVAAADRVAGWFVTALLVIAAGTALAWWFVDASRALPIFVAVLVVSCPCALSLATPAALVVATGAMSRAGLLVTRGHAIETLARATHFAFDKTGTLTHGRLRLARTASLGDLPAEQALHIAAALERGSEHAVGMGIAAAASDAASLPATVGLMSIPGQGMEGTIDGRRYRIGRAEFVQALHGRPVPDALTSMAQGGDTIAALGDDRDWIVAFVFADVLREGAVEAVHRLREAGCRTLILSGDTQAAVMKIARTVGIADAYGGLSPEDKHRRIVELQRAGAVVAMAGDGVNDAPVLAQAQVSIAMGYGAELARAKGDMVLLAEDLHPLVRGMELARRALAVIRQNLAWAVVYNVIALPLAMLGYVTPWLAGIGMSASSLLVVLNALRLDRTRPSRPTGRRSNRWTSSIC